MKERKGAILALISSVFRLTDEIDVRLSMLIFVASSSDLKQNSKSGENLHKVTVQIMVLIPVMTRALIALKYLQKAM